jgi:hypothetical protein
MIIDFQYEKSATIKLDFDDEIPSFLKREFEYMGTFRQLNCQKSYAALALAYLITSGAAVWTPSQTEVIALTDMHMLHRQNPSRWF